MPGVQKVPYLASLLSGLILGTSFAPFYWSFGVFCGLVPLLWVVWGRNWREAGKYGFISGVGFFGVLIWWIVPTISRYGHLPAWASWPVVGLLVCYLAIYPAIWAGISGFVSSRLGWSPFVALGLSALWVLLEWIRGHLFSGFPWGLLAYGLSPIPVLIQTADLWGPYGISFLVVFINLCLLGISLMVGVPSLLRVAGSTRQNYIHPFIPWKQVAVSAGAVVVVLGGMAGYGLWSMDRVHLSEVRYRSLGVAAIQGAIPQDQKWAPSFASKTIGIYEKLSIQALRDLKRDIPRLLVWPETAMPFYFQESGKRKEELLDFAIKHRCALLVGSPAYLISPGNEVSYLNSAFLLAPDGKVHGQYNKRHLVPFGEYLPWKWITWWVKGLLPSAGEFVPGTSDRPLVWQRLRLGILICFESIFPGLSRKSVRDGANLLAVITNDAWFGKTGAPLQHADMAVFRAVESRRWLIRAANTGVSEIIAPWGEEYGRTPIFVRTYITHVAKLRNDITLFARYGDAWIIVVFLLLSVGCCIKAVFLSIR